MERIDVLAEVREVTGKKDTKQLRREGIVPGIVYKGGKETIHLKIIEKDLVDILHSKAGENAIISLKFKGKRLSPKTVIIKEIQHHVTKDLILHVDFNEISLTETLKVNVPVIEKGESPGVVKDGGVLDHVLHEVEVECLPTQIPERLEVDISNMNIGDSVYVKDLTAPPGVKIVNDPELTVISIEPPHVEEVAPVEGAEEITEPELIREKKEEEPEEAEEAPEKKAPKEQQPPKAGKEPAGGKEKQK